MPEPYGKIADPGKLRDELVAELRRWIEAGKPKGEPPLSPKGDAIRKVRVASKDKVAVSVRGGTADRGDMARVDVFAKANKRGKREFYLVPIYPHQVADRVNWPVPPDRAPAAHKAESEWTVIDSSFEFCFSMYPNSFVQVVTSKGQVVDGYYKSFGIDGCSIVISSHTNSRENNGSPGSKTLLEFTKFNVNRLGNKHPITSEVRTWHGEVCT